MDTTLAACGIPAHLLPERERHSRRVIYSTAEEVHVKLMAAPTKKHLAKVVLMSDCLLIHGKGVSVRLDLKHHVRVNWGEAGMISDTISVHVWK